MYLYLRLRINTLMYKDNVFKRKYASNLLYIRKKNSWFRPSHRYYCLTWRATDESRPPPFLRLRSRSFLLFLPPAILLYNNLNLYNIKSWLRIIQIDFNDLKQLEVWKCKQLNARVGISSISKSEIISSVNLAKFGKMFSSRQSINAQKIKINIAWKKRVTFLKAL